MTTEQSRVRLNGDAVDLPRGATLADAVARVAAETAGIAVALNGEVAPRARWESITLGDGDVVDVVTAKQGG